MLYVYGITGRVESPAEATGLRGAPLRAVRDGDLSAIVSDHDDLRLEATEDELWTHESAVETLTNGHGILPMRFGTVLADDEAVRSLLRRQRSDLDQALTRVRGAFELAVRASVELDGEDAGGVPVTGGGAGTAYMLGRLERRRRGQELARLIHEPLAQIARESIRRPRLGSQPLLKGAYLVDRGEVEGFRSRVAELEIELPAATITCTGPWPPYSFVSAPASS